jgi:hypothetical protein
VFPRIGGLTSPIVMLFNLGLMLTAQLLMLMQLSKNLLVVVLFPSLLISLDHIHYFCCLNLNGGFLTMFGSILLQLVGTILHLIMDKLIGDFLDLKDKVFLIKLAKVLEPPEWKRHLCLTNMGWR